MLTRSLQNFRATNIARSVTKRVSQKFLTSVNYWCDVQLWRKWKPIKVPSCWGKGAPRRLITRKVGCMNGWQKVEEVCHRTHVLHFLRTFDKWFKKYEHFYLFLSHKYVLPEKYFMGKRFLNCPTIMKPLIKHYVQWGFRKLRRRFSALGRCPNQRAWNSLRSPPLQITPTNLMD